MEQNITPNTFTLQVDNGNIPYLAEAAKWGKFLSILGFIFCALMIVYGLFAGTIMTKLLSQNPEMDSMPSSYLSMGSSIMTVVIILFALLYFFPSLYMFNFASKMQTAIRNNDQVYLNASFKNLKSCLKFWGILLIIIISFYAIVAIFALVAGYTFSR